MAKKSNSQIAVKPRKLPKQQRGTETVGWIIRSTAQLLIRQDYERISTNHIAEKAGVSIGALYQYFPNKESVFATLVDRQIEKDIEFLKAAMEDAQNASDRPQVREFIKAIILVFSTNRNLRKVIIRQIPSLTRLQRRGMIELNAKKWILRILGVSVQVVPTVENEVAAFVLIRAVIGAVRAAVMEDSPFLLEKSFEDSLVVLVESYLGNLKL